MSFSRLATAVSHAVSHADESLVTAALEVGEDQVSRCEVCGMQCEAPIEVSYRGRLGTFDSFECAIHAMASRCERCRCRIIGHAVESAGKLYCCSHCAQAAEDK